MKSLEVKLTAIQWAAFSNSSCYQHIGLIKPIVFGFMFTLLFLLVACQSDLNNKASELKVPAGQLSIQYPLNETIFPPDIVAPKIIWQDNTAEVVSWQVSIFLKEQVLEQTYTAEKNYWQPTEIQWHQIKQGSSGKSARLVVAGLNQAGKVISSGYVNFETSIDPVGDAIFYREVPLPFIDAVKDPSQIRWRFGSVDSQKRPPIVLEKLPVCGNCHSFSGDGKTLGLDVDYGNDKGGYAILDVEKEMVLNDEKIITWSDYKREDEEQTFGLLSQVSPDGRYIISTVKDRAVFVATPGIEYSQLFFPIKGILVVYDREKKTYTALPGADDPNYVQSNPTWSPDGKYVVFARAKAYQKNSIANATSVLLSEKDVPEFTEDREPYKYDLYRVPFNAGKGGKAEPIKGASQNGKSNFFAKFSPDGKWIVYTQAENYMLLMPDSELYIIPAEGGKARRLQANTSNMNSWHSFSSNSRWLVFSSKVNTPYTQLFLTHIDENGNSSPPVVLDRFTGVDRAANIPEFVPIPANTIAQIDEQFLDAYSFLRAGMANERTGNYADAVKSYLKGLEVEPNNVELLNSMGFAQFQQGNSEAAIDALEKALAVDPNHHKAHNNMALASIDIGELELAEIHYRESLAIEPQPAIYNDLGYVLERLGLPDEAIEAYEQALELDPDSATAHYNLSTHLARDKSYPEAEAHLRAALKVEPSARTYTGLGAVLWQQGKADEAIRSLQTAIKANPKSTAASDTLGKIYVAQGKFEKAAVTYQQLAEQQPSAIAYQGHADALMQLGKKEEAEKVLTKVQALKDNLR